MNDTRTASALFRDLIDGSEQLSRTSSESGIFEVKSGNYVCMEGDLCRSLPLVIDGSVRVYKTAESGREITLYRIESGESCVVTASCIIGERPFPAFAAAETDVRAIMVPAGHFRQLVRDVDAWHDYVFGLLSGKLADVIELVEEVAFKRVDERLARRLVRSAHEDDPEKPFTVVATHESIASDLGTSREVVTRLLRDFEEAGWIRRGNRGIEVLDAQALISG